MKSKYLLTSLLIACISSPAQAQHVIKVKESKVLDGDTMDIVSTKGKTHRVRLLGIDAPELKQDFGENSKSSLEYCLKFGDSVVVKWSKKDRYGRLLGKVVAGSVDCNLTQIKRGMAWYYKEYAQNLTKTDRKRYAEEFAIARKSVIGVWSKTNPIKPSDYRKDPDKYIGYKYHQAPLGYDRDNPQPKQEPEDKNSPLTEIFLHPIDNIYIVVPIILAIMFWGAILYGFVKWFTSPRVVVVKYRD